MEIAIVIIGLAFYWLMVESKWLTVRLQRYTRELVSTKGAIDIGGILMLGIGMVFVAVRMLVKRIMYSEVEYEADMVGLWKIYGRKQPKRVEG